MKANRVFFMCALFMPVVTGSAQTVRAELAVAPGAAPQELELRLTLTIADGWHVYGKTGGGTEGQAPLKLHLRLPPGLIPVGDWQWPPPRMQSGLETYAGRQVFRHKLRQAEPVAARIYVTASYQACSTEVCDAPEEIEAFASTRP